MLHYLHLSPLLQHCDDHVTTTVDSIHGTSRCMQ